MLLPDFVMLSLRLLQSPEVHVHVPIRLQCQYHMKQVVVLCLPHRSLFPPCGFAPARNAALLRTGVSGVCQGGFSCGVTQWQGHGPP